MSCFELEKKLLLPSKRAMMRSFTSLIKYNFQKLRRSKTITTVFSVIPRRRNNLYRHRQKAHYTTKLCHQLQNLSAVYVDELFHHHLVDDAHQNTKLEKLNHQAYISSSSPSNTMENGEAIWEVEELGEVDLRAEIFIRKFKEEMRLQRHKSIKEYQEMLARGLS